MGKITERKTLIIDDMAAFRESMQSCLTKIGFQNLSMAMDGKDAWEQIKQAGAAGDPFRLIMSDINMPNCSGVELVKLVRSEPSYNDCLLIMASTENETETIIDVVSAGADNYILKPYTIDTVKAKLVETLKKKGISG